MPLQFGENNVDTQEEEREPQSILTPRPTPSGSIRLKLIFLVGLLGLVILAMNEAGKPENWVWMGFDKEEIRLASEKRDGNGASTERPVTNGDPGFSSSPNTSSHANGSSSPSFSIIGNQPAQKPNLDYNEFDYPLAATRFWKQAYPRLGPEKQKLLMRMMRQLRTGEVLTGDQQSGKNEIVESLQRQRELYQQRLFDELTLTPNDAPNRQEMSEQYYESEDVWNGQIAPALKATVENKDITMAQQQVVLKLQTVFDHLAHQQVQDKTTIGWIGDSESWRRIWEQLQSPDDSKGLEVRRIQLMSQPRFYRGKKVSLSGWVRAGMKVELDEGSSLGRTHYYELWLRPADTNVGPYCLYCAELPGDGQIPELTDSLKSLNQKVEFDARFFKVRKYSTAERKVEYCPVLVTDKITLIQTKEDSGPASEAFSSYWLIPAVIGLPLFAVCIAWAAYQSSDSTRSEPGKRTQQQIDEGLGELKNNPNVETDLERVLKLHDVPDETDN